MASDFFRRIAARHLKGDDDPAAFRAQNRQSCCKYRPPGDADNPANRHRQWSADVLRKGASQQREAGKNGGGQ